MIKRDALFWGHHFYSGTILAALQYWQRDSAESNEPISQHFAEETPLTVEEIDDQHSSDTILNWRASEA